MEKTQHEYFLNEQMKAIQKEIGDEEGGDEFAEIEDKIKKTKLLRTTAVRKPRTVCGCQPVQRMMSAMVVLFGADRSASTCAFFELGRA
jgi:ATP-dependent Lon protease